MPAASQPSPAIAPIPLSADEASIIKDSVLQFFGESAVLRNFSSSPSRIDIHVETDRDIGMAKYDCLGVILTHLDRPIGLEVTRRGMRIRGTAKLAYRNGVIF